MNRVLDTLYNVLDQYTGEYLTYNKVTTYSDGTPMTDGKTDGVIYRKLGTEYFRRNFTGPMNVKWFGPLNAVNLQKALDVCPDRNTLELDPGSVIDLGGATVNVNNIISIKGNHCTVKNGIFWVGTAVRRDWNTSIVDIVFDNCMMEIRNVRRMTIDCIHKNVSKAIYLNPEGTATGIVHSVAQLVIRGTFATVDYNVFADHAIWDSVSDIICTGIISNYARITHFHLAGCDGFVLSNSTLFFLGETDIKERHVYIGQSNFVVITGNNFFESGTESIYLGIPKKVTITGNNFARIGQRNLFSCIVLTGVTIDVFASITGNTADFYSKHFVEVSVRGGVVNCKGNALHFGISDFLSYYGTESLSASPHYYVENKSNDGSALIADFTDEKVSTKVNRYMLSSFAGLELNILERGLFYAESWTLKVLGVVASTPGTVLHFSNSAGGSGSGLIYSGELQVTVRATSGASSTSNLSQYYLQVYRRSSSAGNSITEVSKMGLTSGGAANHPSFTFSLDAANNALIATPVGLTAGDFTFAVQAKGDILVG
ncbi:hypothetical protein ACSBL2_24915 [Pedobacter sp. AW31-3R]|uniref:hypothetical protein n=1 Tax=Pedobacter sp. AW31-3R TaxID=3445781 RepID=UPI003FA127C5